MAPRIYNIIPYCHQDEGKPRGQDVGTAYNEYMKIIPEDAWACILDHDVCQTTRQWFWLLEDAVEQQPDAGAFVGVTNRLNPKKSGWQLAPEVGRAQNNMAYHWSVGSSRFDNQRYKLRDVTDVEDEGWKPLSGFAFVVSRKTWDRIGGAKTQGMSYVDWGIHRAIRDIGLRIYLIEAWYMYHWFKFNRDLS